MTSAQDAVIFINKINENAELQEKVKQLKKGEWAAFFALAAEEGLAVDRGAFMQGCLSPQVNHFCPALIAFAGQLHTYKM